MKYTDQNGAIISSWKNKYDLPWMQPITHEQFLQAARSLAPNIPDGGIQDGDNHDADSHDGDSHDADSHDPNTRNDANEGLLTLTPNRKVPKAWYADIKGKKVLGLAAGGGQQMAILSALGAKCTLMDISDQQLESDRLVSEREGYPITLIKGDMTETFPFADDTFDYVINPVSNHYIEDVYPVFREIHRVLKPGGTFLAGLDTGIYWAFWGEDDSKLQRRLPFNPLKDEELRQALLDEDMSFLFSHTLEEQIGGQLKAGLILKDLLEDTNEAGPFFDYNVPTFILTRAVKGDRHR